MAKPSCGKVSQKGQPNKRRFALRGWWLTPFALLWAGFAIFWEASVLASNAPLLFRVWGIPFVLVGLYLVLGRFFVAAREADTTWYAVTNRRILIRSGIMRRTTTELDIRHLPSLQISEQGSHFGAITFGNASPFGAFTLPNWPGARANQSPAFQSIASARELYGTIRQAASVDATV